MKLKKMIGDEIDEMVIVAIEITIYINNWT